MIAENQTFNEMLIHLDGGTFKRVTFNRCRLVFSGILPVVLDSCHFDNCAWSLEGPAATTLKLMAAIYAVPGGAPLIEATFENIRGNKKPAGLGEKLN
jgi:hypothetical protein